MQKLFVVIVVSLLLTISPAWAADKKSLSSSELKALQEENARLRKELSACQNTKNETAEAQRREAIQSLKAIRSALSTGANLQEFKKYQIESRIKVDALPDTSENQIIKEISDIYKDAVTFGIIRLTGNISDSELEDFRLKYNNNVLLKHLEAMNPNLVPQGRRHDVNQDVLKPLMGMKPNDDSRGFTYRLNKSYAEEISKLLISIAELEFSLSQLK